MKHFIFGALLATSSLALHGCQTSSLMNEAGRIMQAGGSIMPSGTLGALGNAALSNSEISAGLKEALRLGSTQVVKSLGRTNGFNLDQNIRIPLPSQLQQVNNALSMVGMGGLTNDLETRLNTAAEIATPKAKQLFINAIQGMSIQDAYGILKGPQNAATQYLRGATGSQLKQDMAPLIQSALSQAGAIKLYDQVIGQYSALPFMPDVKADLNNYVAEKALDGIFYYVAEEELKIRTNPAARTTELLQKVFAAQ